MGSKRSADAIDANAVDDRIAGRWCDDDDFMTRGSQPRCQVLKVKLDASNARMIPVADETDLQVASVAALGSRRATM